MVLTKHELKFKAMVDAEWAWLAYSGLWQDPLKTDLDMFINATQKRVSGLSSSKCSKEVLELLEENQNIRCIVMTWQHMEQVYF